MGDQGEDDAHLASVEELNPPPPGGRRRTWLIVGSVVAVVVLAVGVAAARTGDDSSRTKTRVLTSHAAKAVLAALGTSTGTGGYEVAYEFEINAPSGPPPTVCGNPDVSHGNGPGAASGRESVRPTSGSQRETCFSIDGRGPVTVTGHGTVHLNPYFLETTSNVDTLGEITIRTDGNLIAEQGGGNYGDVEDGQPLSGFASLVQGTFGDGPGALTMLGLASPTGYLSLSADAVTDVTPAGSGVVDGTPVTYYDVVSDTAAMRDLPGLTDEQRTTIDAALQVLDRSGFVEARARIGIDADGYIRESSSTAKFADGTTMKRHMTLSKFGCIGTGPTPAHPTGTPEALPPDCATPSPTTPPPSAVAEPTSSTTTTTDAGSAATSSPSTTSTSTTTSP